MARPTTDQPTPAELELLRILWDRGPSTVRQVLEALTEAGRGRAYTTVMSLLNVMAEKGQVTRTPEGRAFLYAARRRKETTLGGLVGDLWRRAFDRSAGALVARLLDEADPSPQELAEIRAAIDAHERGRAARRGGTGEP